MTRLSAENLENLVLFRLAVVSSSRPSPSDVKKALAPFVKHRLSEAEWREHFSQTLETLLAGGQISKTPLKLTELGGARVRRVLRLDAEPRARDWRQFKHKYLRALVLPSATAGKKLEPAYAVLAQSLQVSTTASATSTGVVDAWLARKLELTKQHLTLNALRIELLARQLEIPALPNDTLDLLVRRAAAKLANAPKGDAASILEALTARWLDAKTEPPALVPKSNAGSASGVPLERLIPKVEAATRSPTVHRFGADKAFISSVWKVLEHDPEVSLLGEQGFKQALVEAHRRGVVELTRADLVAAMDPEDVRASETHYLNATYHFIQVAGETA